MVKLFMKKMLIGVLLCFGLISFSECTSSHSKKLGILYNVTSSTRFLVFDVNSGEGFNLRRDVYGRAANLVRKMIDNGEDWILVVPPWRHLYHWKTHYLPQEALPWWKFFDLANMNYYIPVMEFYEFLRDHTTEDNVIDEVAYLQRHKDNYKSGYKELIEVDECNSDVKHWYRKDLNSQRGYYEGYFWGMRELRTKTLNCVGTQGGATILKEYLSKTKARSILVDRFEQLLHIEYGSVEFYKARRSLVFAKHLREEGNKYRAKYLKSKDDSDNTPYNEDWRLQVPTPESAKGGPYIGVHMRRGDFANSRHETVPSIEEVGLEIEKQLKKFKLKKVYISTDGTEDELEELRSYVTSGKLYQFPRPKKVIEKFKDGGVAIIDQWIVAHARYFIGSCESTFSFRIYEERDILGFPEKNTYNCICGKQSPPDQCHPPSGWRVKFS